MSDQTEAINVTNSSTNKKDGVFAVPKNASPKKHNFLCPSPIPCRRTRTTSVSLLAADSPLQQGTVEHFCREKGHGFIKPDGEEKPIFLHISDIEDEYVVQNGDRVQFHTIPMPPKRVEQQAVEVRLIQLNDEKPHKRWDSQPDI